MKCSECQKDNHLLPDSQLCLGCFEKVNAIVTQQLTERVIDLETIVRKIQARRKVDDCRLERLFAKAAMDMPEGFEIQLGVEQGAGWISLYQDGEHVEPDWDESGGLADQMEGAIYQCQNLDT